MGLDIFATLDNHEELLVHEEFEELEDSGLSRTFCNFMCRRNVIDGTPELNQLGQLTGVDIGFLYEMEEYSEDWEIDEMMSIEDDEAAIQEIESEMSSHNQALENNIEKVHSGLIRLIEKLSLIPDLPDKLDDNGYDTLQSEHYFSDFNKSRGDDSYLDNNLGQDLRYLLRITKYGIDNGSKTIYFNYG